METLGSTHIEACNYLDQLLAHSLIQKHSNDRERIEFCHPIFQEYYAAKYLLQKLPDMLKNEKELKKDYLNLLKWTDSLEIMQELIDDKVSAMNMIQLAFEIDLKLGARLIKSSSEEIQEQGLIIIIGKGLDVEVEIELFKIIQSKTTQKRLRILLHEQQKIRKDRIRKAMPSMVEPLKSYLISELQKDDKADRVEFAKTSLGKTMNLGRIQLLIKDLEDEDKSIRKQAAISLGENGHTEAVPELIELLNDTQINRNDRSYIAALLGRIGGPEAIHPLIESTKDSYNFVKAASIRSLGQIGDPIAIPTLVELLDDEEEGIPETAAEALTKMKSLKSQ